MTTGTKSLLWGVHNIVWHPITVALGWRRLYGEWPKGWEWIAILVHDWGYWGCEKMDDEKGEQHPVVGAKIVCKLYRWFHPREFPRYREHQLFDLCKFHSRYLSAAEGREPSKLCWADKMSPVFDPPWFYILRARLSGEIKEYRANAAEHIPANWTYYQWYNWFRDKSLLVALNKKSPTPRYYANDSTLR